MASKQIAVILFIIVSFAASAELPRLHVEGRQLVTEQGDSVVLHGFGQTYSPWFNEMCSVWNDYDVQKCLSYNQGLIDDMLAAGWEVNFLRLHMDPYWSNTPGQRVEGEHDISVFSMDRFKAYVDSVFAPMAEFAISRGMYVVMRPPGVCPHTIAPGDDYNQYLKQVWGYVSQYPRLARNPHVMFELANEPVNITGGEDALTQIFQSVVDTIRANGCQNILWVPGAGYQSHYEMFARYPIQGENIGYAVHVYPGWYGSDAIEPSHELGGDYGGHFERFAAGWEAQVMPVARFAPIMVTEMDWAPKRHNASWGKSITGRMYGEGFGGNFKVLTDLTGNCSWMIFTGADLLARFAQGSDFLRDPEACPWPVYHWFRHYAGHPLPPIKETRTVDTPAGPRTIALTPTSVEFNL